MSAHDVPGGNVSDPMVRPAKRQKLSPWESAHCSVGKRFATGSSLRSTCLARLWDVLSRGSHHVEYRSYFCSHRDDLCGRAIRELASNLSRMGSIMGSVELVAFMKEDALTIIKREYEDLKPHLVILCAKHVQIPFSFVPLERGVRIAADALYYFLEADSLLRDWLSVMASGDGTLWSAYVLDKKARASISPAGGGIQRHPFGDAAVSFLCQERWFTEGGVSRIVDVSIVGL